MQYCRPRLKALERSPQARKPAKLGNLTYVTMAHKISAGCCDSCYSSVGV